MTRRDVTKAFGAFKAVDNASVAVEEGEILGLIGPNGAGKSTFFNCLTGDLPIRPRARCTSTAPTSPACRPKRGRGSALARTFQVPLTFESMSVLDNVTIGAFLRHPSAARRPRQGARGDRTTSASGRSPMRRPRASARPGRKRLEIARALASEPKVLLLDEAMAGLTPTEVREAIELVRHIHGGGITIVIVEHIMEVIVSLAQTRHRVPPGPRDRARHAARGHPQSDG